MSEIDTSKKPQRYYIPSGGGVAPNPCGLIYLREEADAMINALASERDAAVARAEARVAELEAEVERLRAESCATCGGVMYWGDECCPECSPEAAAEKDQKLFAAGWTAAIEAAASWVDGEWLGQSPYDAARLIRAITMPTDAAAALASLTAQARAQGMREALEAVKKSREEVIHSAQRNYIDCIARGHDRAEAAILARAEEIEKEARNDR